MTNVQDIYELSPMQHGMLFASVTARDTGSYTMKTIWELVGDLDVETYGRAWQRTIDRYPVLRTSFHWEDQEKPLQVVYSGVELPLERLDWSASTPEEQGELLEELLREERRRGFVLDEAPLMRVTVIDCGRARWRVIWAFHHIILEGWSASMVLRDVLGYYRAFTEGRDLELDPPVPYRDYITWIHQQDTAGAEAYWRERLRGFSDPTPILGDRTRAEITGLIREHAFRDLRLSEETTAALRAMARKHGLTMNTIVEGAWAILLNRYSGEEDVVFGSIVSGRSAPVRGIDEMVGLFINMLPSRVRVSHGRPLLEWLRELQSEQVRMRSFEYLPLVQIKGWSELPPGKQFFDSLIVFENWLGSLDVEDWAEGLECRSALADAGGPGIPVGVIVSPGAEHLDVLISFDSERGLADDVARMLQHLRVIFDGIARDPDQRLGQVPMLPEAERERLLVEWNRTEAAVAEGLVHERFQAAARDDPQALAVVSGNGDTTYSELDARSNQLAHHLRELGVGRGSRVGLCVERDPSMIVGMLGVLKAGAAYVPLDPHYPAERLRFLLEDSRVAVLLTRRDVRLPEGGPPRLCLDTDWEAISRRSTEPPAVALTADDLAYVIYTSGSTGTPKGVMVPHGALANYVNHAIGEFGLQPNDRMLQFASISFDTAAEEIYPTLACGATLVLRTEAVLGSVAAFLQECEQQRITVVDLPTAFWHVVVDGMDADGLRFPPCVGLVILGGEAARSQHVATWRRISGDRPRLLNTYGPTEGTIVATSADLTAESAEAAREPASIPIGRPVSNVRTFLLDPHGRPVPIGVPGELHLGGAGLARGYLDRPGLTAERFVPDPFDGRPGSRLYRTGDLARYRPDGNLEYVGRLDEQVKFRGYRIELEEIETILAKNDGVREAVVLLREDQPGQPRLVAYVVAEAGRVTAEELTAFLQQRLPAYMVPSAIVFLDALPLTRHGKVDRRALPAPERAAPEDEGGLVGPRTELESVLAEIWQEALGIERVGVHQNFFDLGGHSLLLMPVLANIEKKLGVKLGPGELVLPTLGQLAATVEEHIKAGPRVESKGLMRRLVDSIWGAVSSGSAPGNSS